MELSGQKLINASRETVYAALNDPEILRQCIPGCESLNKMSDTEMDAVVATKIGPVKAKFNGAVQLINLNPRTATPSSAATRPFRLQRRMPRFHRCPLRLQKCRQR